MQKNRTVRGQISLIVIGIVIALVLVSMAAFALRGGGAVARTGSSADSFVVRRGSFDIAIPVSGELAALKQIEIRNNLDSRAVITEIVPEGVFVNAGDVLLRLNDEDVRNRVRDAQDKVNVAEAALIAAQSKLEIQLKTQKAELEKADVAFKLADLALKAWEEGDDVTKMKELQLAVETNEKDYNRLADRYQQSQALLDKNFISKDEFKLDEIEMIKSKSALEKAKLELEVYKSYQQEHDRAEKQSDLDQARSERERVEKENEAEVRSAKSEVDSKAYQLDSAKEQLAELQQQLAYCTVTAPAPGLVVYYASTQSGMGRNDGRPPQVGTELSRNEQVIILPDTSKMIATVKISEALVGQIEKGQRATVACDALPDRVLNGEVQSVGVLAESGGWRDPNRRDYTVKILLKEGTELGLKPAMRCKANIYVGRVTDAMYVPIQAVSRAGMTSYVYVPEGSGYAQCKVVTGRTSELYIEIADGLKEGETVLLRQPDPDEVVARLAIPKNESQQRSDGDDAANAAGAQTEGGPAAMQGGTPGGRRPEGSPTGGGRHRGGGGGGGGASAGNGASGGMGRSDGGMRRGGNGAATGGERSNAPPAKE